MRVVSLTCSNTEIACALGCADLLVGVDACSDFPEKVVEKLPSVGKDLDIDVDAVRALRPDLVLASLTVPGHEKVVGEIEAAGLRYLAPEPVSLQDVYADIRLVGEALGVPDRASALVARMRNAIGESPEEAAPGAPRVLVEWWPKPVIAAGRLSWVDDLLRGAGACNPMGNRRVKSAPIADHDAVAMNPDAVVISWCGVPESHYRPEIVYRRPAWQDVPAVRERRVFAIHEAFLGRPGPRLVEGARKLRELVAACETGRG